MTVFAPSPTIRVGRLETHPSGIGWQVHLPDGTKLVAPNNLGLTHEQAAEALDRIERWQREQRNNPTGRTADRAAGTSGRRDVEQASYAGPQI